VSESYNIVSLKSRSFGGIHLSSIETIEYHIQLYQCSHIRIKKRISAILTPNLSDFVALRKVNSLLNRNNLGSLNNLKSCRCSTDASNINTMRSNGIEARTSIKKIPFVI
jgi:hypothetical protein